MAIPIFLRKEDTMANVNDIISMSRKYIGTKESPMNSNNVVFNTDYYGKAVNGDNYSWCAVFIWDIFRMCKASDLFFGGQKTAYTPTLAKYYQDNKQWYSTPVVGDIVFYKWKTSTRICHVGIVEKVNSDGTITTIEGNTSVGNDSNGGEVMERVRPTTYVVGYGRPKYTKENNDMIKMIDVSAYNKGLNYKALKSAGVNYLIAKIIRKDLTVDKMFTTHLKGSKGAGITCKYFYNYSYANTVDKAKTDAQSVVDIFKENKDTVGLDASQCTIWMDVEDNVMKNLGSKLADIINAYETVIKSAGFGFGVYTGQSFFMSYIKPYINNINCNKWWIARYYKNGTVAINDTVDENYNPTNTIGIKIYAWQYSSKLIIPSVSSGVLDCSQYYGQLSKANATNVTPSGNSGIKTIVANADKVNVRSGNGTNFPVVEMLSKGTEVKVQGLLNGWYLIGTNKWISSKYVVSNKTGKVTANTLNLRLDAGIDKQDIGDLKLNDSVIVLNSKNDTSGTLWYLVSVGDKCGWVSSKYIK